MQPTVQELRSRHGELIYREQERELGAERFRHLRERVANGLEWGVGAVVADDEDNLLLVREADRWSIPGGGVEQGESHSEALEREVYEETGVEISVGSLQAITAQTVTNDGDRVQFHFATYTASPTSTTTTDDPGIAGEQIETARWVQQLPADTLDRELIDAVR